MKKINYKLLFSTATILGLLVVISMFFVLEQEEGKESSNIVVVILTKLFDVLRFPTHTLFPRLAEQNSIVFCAGLLFNCLFYALIFERIHTYIVYRTADQSEHGLNNKLDRSDEPIK